MLRLSRSRSKTGADGAQLEDFYECTVLTDWVEDVPVVFLYDYRICGWYTTAKIYRRVFHPSLFLEGNICARSTDAVLLREDAWILADWLFEENGWDFKDKLYRVIEDEEEGYEALAAILKRHYEKTVPVHYDLAPSMLNKGIFTGHWLPGKGSPVTDFRQKKRMMRSMLFASNSV